MFQNPHRIDLAADALSGSCVCATPHTPVCLHPCRQLSTRLHDALDHSLRCTRVWHRPRPLSICFARVPTCNFVVVWGCAQALPGAALIALMCGLLQGGFHVAWVGGVRRVPCWSRLSLSVVCAFHCRAAWLRLLALRSPSLFFDDAPPRHATLMPSCCVAQLCFDCLATLTASDQLPFHRGWGSVQYAEPPPPWSATWGRRGKRAAPGVLFESAPGPRHRLIACIRQPSRPTH